MARPRAERPTYSLTMRAARYYVQWWEDGAARRISCRTSKLATARRFLAEFVSGRNTPLPPEAPTIGAILEGYRAERQQGRSQTLSYNVAHLNAFFGDLPADVLTKERVRAYMAKRRKTGAGGAPVRATKRPLADSTLRRELLTLRAALVWAQHEGWIATVPHVEATGQGKPRDRWLTREEAATLLDSAKQVHVRVFIALSPLHRRSRGRAAGPYVGQSGL